MFKSYKARFILLTALLSVDCYAAIPIDVSQQSVTFLATAVESSQLKQEKIEIDSHQVKHVRLKQTYQGYSVWGADVLVHYPAKHNLAHDPITMNGMVYQNLRQDLQETPSYVFSPAQAAKAEQIAVQLFQKQTSNKSPVQATESHLMVYVDQQQHAHWAYLLSFLVDVAENVIPIKPVYILDAVNFTIYQQWNDIETLANVLAGGFGGNDKIGRLVYDGLSGHFPQLAIERDSQKKTCYLKNAAITVKNFNQHNTVSHFNCSDQRSEHGNVYWDGDSDAVNGAYSPENDALYAGLIVKGLYQDWYQIPVLVNEKGQAKSLTMRVHQKIDNAYWDGKQMTFGDGGEYFYPLVSTSTAAHEISHGFTEEHSRLLNLGQSGGLNEAFSDMAAQAAEFYATHKNSWQIGAEIIKAPNQSLRYLDEPTRDCGDRKPGANCSISQLKDYYEGLDVHFSCGIFNKAFYLLATAPNWDTRKAFNVMVQANRYYWAPLSTFMQAACGVVKAVGDYQYDIDTVKQAFLTVGIDIKKCH